jgi:hypothetical protein
MLQFTVIIVLLAIASVLCVTEIFDAVAKDNRAAIEAVLAEDPSSLNIIGPGGQTPLMNAVLSGKVTAVKVLLEHNADVTIPEKDGYTPLVSIGFPTPLDSSYFKNLCVFEFSMAQVFKVVLKLLKF